MRPDFERLEEMGMTGDGRKKIGGYESPALVCLGTIEEWTKGGLFGQVIDGSLVIG